MAKIKDLDPSERPREKALKYGVDSLSDEELLALIIGSGTKAVSVLEIAEHITKTYKNLANFSLENYTGLNAIKGIKKSKTLLLLAIFEFHKRVIRQNNSKKTAIGNALDVYSRYYDFSLKTQEILLLLLLNKKGEVIKEVELYKGTSSSIDISIKEIMYQILIGQGDSFIVVHNHPSGNVLPSNDDIITTSLLKRKASELDIELKDHIIITKDAYYSFNENERKKKLNNQET